MTKETWVQFADRVKPEVGQVFKDIYGEDWLFENYDYFLLTKHGKTVCISASKTNITAGNFIPCSLVDAIEHVEKPKMRKMTYENKWAVYYRVGNRAHVLFSDFLPRSFLNEFTEVEGTLRAEGDGTQYVHWSVEIAQWENKPVVEMMHAFLAVEDATPLDFMCDSNEKRQ